MRRILPSQVVAFIDDIMPIAIKMQVAHPNTAQTVRLERTYAGPLQVIVRLVDEIPTYLIDVGDSDYFTLLAVVETTRSTLAQWQHGADPSIHLDKVRGISKTLNPVTLIRQILRKCPDDLPSPQSHQLAFIEDAVFRGGLQSDITSIERALIESEWKTATVLAGSVIEAVLLWALEQKDQRAPGTSLAQAKTQNLSRGPNLVDWDLHCYVMVAAALKIIEKDTGVSANLAKSFRNLIHPGKSVRQQQQCDRGTARSAAGALDHVVRDVEKWNAAGQP